ncbi:efflux RND transporter permease subunit [Pleomorphomonas sp. JP5]|uniref:efflux RND transporter permease subunit n=1 Tax=Pleomorphomonas sp. JP5 TaxID=2942998 RepID=UPI0020436FBF|nr:efflux RND transporter permease subunit [Pleomorphomonas sp. JP5]MCM5558692.1 efflux RND transporter permease subunit [Pleomorphomonas sp. JP5]
MADTQMHEDRDPSRPFNLSAWAIDHASLVWYLLIVSMVAGALAYMNLGREEDPSFTIKTMVIQAQWPGASIDDTISQLTDRIEKKLEELDVIDYTRSVTSPGKTTIFVNLQSTISHADVKPTWKEVRNMVADLSYQFPQGVLGPFFDDRFGDVFGNVYAFTADGLTQRQLRDYVEQVRTSVLTVPDAGRVDLIGAQDEVIYLEFNPRQLANLGLDQQAVMQALQAQNAIVPSGTLEAGAEKISVRVSGQFVSEESLKTINLRVNNRFFRLSDVVTITRGFTDPPDSLFRYNGQPAIGLAISMKAGANILEFGDALRTKIDKVVARLPVGVGVHMVSDQPKVVQEAIGGFTKSLFEAVAIVLVVSFLSLGMRAGVVVALSIPLVLAITFLSMEVLGITLQRVSLGALIIALGLLVDDAMIAIEMMVARLEKGETLRQAAMQIYTSTAFPRLTGTLVTIAGFIPIGLNSSSAGEYTFTLFVVLSLSLLISWAVAGIFVPLLGVTLLPSSLKKEHDKPGALMAAYQKLLRLVMRHRWPTIAVTLVAFAGSVYGLQFVQQQFFPTSDRPEVFVDWTLPQNSTIANTKAQMDRFEATLAENPDVQSWTSFVGQSSIRFLLTLDPKAPANYIGQTVIVAKDHEARERIVEKLGTELRRDFIGMDTYVSLVPLGPPAGRPIQYRLSGPDIQKLRGYAQGLAALFDGDPRIAPPVFDWNEPGRVVKVDILQDKARQLGVSSADIATVLNGTIGGITVTQIPDSTYLVNVVVRGGDSERNAIETIRDLQLPTTSGQSIPLAAIATFKYTMEQPVVARRDRMPTITVSADIIGDTQPVTMALKLTPKIAEFERSLPDDYRIVVGGPVEESEKSQAPIIAVVPLMLLTMATILMIQLQSFRRLFLVFSVAPLALIGVAIALLTTHQPLGFVAILGILALIGILIRNSVILIVQIETLRREGLSTWAAVLQASEQRVRPIILTAAAASLGLIPIAAEGFWGPMAFAMMGGIIIGTLLTILFLPALYVAWFRVPPPETSPSVG